MSVKAKIAAAAATFALAGGGLGMLGTLSASAATHKCGSTCEDLYTQKFGPRYLVATFQGKAAANQAVILGKAASTDPAEDFVLKYLGSVSSFYGQYPRPITSQFDTRRSSISAYEFQYEPNGVPSNFCLSTSPGQVAQAGSKVVLERCGEHRNSAWAIFTGQFAGKYTTSGYGVLINAATDSFSDPLVLTYPVGKPTGVASARLDVEPLHADINMKILNNQQWAWRTGPVR
jgi:hypothetical protein